jgi:hypothetical protein
MKIKQNRKILITILPAQTKYNIIEYEFKINNSLYSQSTNEYIIQPYTLPIGLNKVYLRIRDDCKLNNWSNITQIDIETEPASIIMTEQPFEVLVDKPSVDIEVIITMTGTVNVTVKNQLGTPVPDKTVKMNETSVTTDVNGLASVQNVPYGNQSGTVIY